MANSPDVEIPETIVIPAGEYLMGGIAEDKYVTAVELPPTRIRFAAGFAMGKAPVTQSQWHSVMRQLPHGCAPGAVAACPVVSVSFHDVSSFLLKLSAMAEMVFRLPSEAEWEYACRGGSMTVFPTGTSLSLEAANYLYDENGTAVGTGALTPVSRYPPNRFGLHDMLGNVCEWTADDWHPNHRDTSTDGRPRVSASDPPRRAIRGGGWDHLPRVLRPSWRNWAPETARWDNLGFRIARSL